VSTPSRRPRPLLALAAVLVVACAPNPQEPPVESGTRTVAVSGGTYQRVAADDAAEMLSSDDPVLVNVHVPYEGEIEGTDAFIPYDQIADRLDELPGDRTAALLVYCRTGRMSAIAAETLVRFGYSDVRELDGGFEAWQAAGYPLIVDSERTAS